MCMSNVRYQHGYEPNRVRDEQLEDDNLQLSWMLRKITSNHARTNARTRRRRGTGRSLQSVRAVAQGLLKIALCRVVVSGNMKSLRMRLHAAAGVQETVQTRIRRT